MRPPSPPLIRPFDAPAAALLLALAVSLPGCNHYFARYTVAPPNHGKSLAQVDKDVPFELPGTVIDHKLRVDIDDPPASLSVWVMDPSNERYAGGGEDNTPTFEKTDDGPRVTHEPRATVLLLHGYYDYINQKRILMWARIFAADGYRVVMIDQRGHGASTGEWSTYGVVESHDTRHVLDVIESRGLLKRPLGVAAVSFGSSTGLLLAADDPRVDTVLAVSAFSSMRAVIPDFARAIGFDFSQSRYDDIIDRSGKLAHFDPDDASPVDAIRETDIPVLLIHGEDDNLIPIQHSLRLYAAARRDNVQLLRIKGADHTTLGGTTVEPVRLAAEAWFARYLKPGEVHGHEPPHAAAE